VVPASSIAEARPALAIVSDKEKLDYAEEDAEALRELKIGNLARPGGRGRQAAPGQAVLGQPDLLAPDVRQPAAACASWSPSVEELAAMKKLGTLALREQEQVFDQVMHRVMGRLQNDVA
jgi:hypothetical protein